MPQDQTLQPMLRKLGYWQPLSPEDELSLLDLPHEVKSLNRQGYIVRERDRATHSCVMLSGFSFRHKIVASGARQICAVHMKGDLVDLQNSLLGTADHSVQMLTQGEVALIPREAVKQLAMKRPNIAMAMWYDTLVDGSIFREWIANIGRRTAHARVAHILCEFAVRLRMAGLGEQNQYEFPMTQEQIADATGLTAVHVNRMLRNLEREGLIEREGRGVQIGDWRKLVAAGDFDTTYLHLHENEAALG